MEAIHTMQTASRHVRYLINEGYDLKQASTFVGNHFLLSKRQRLATIRIIRFSPDGISSREGNEHVPVWNHDISLVRLDENHTRYTDRVEIHAGWKTVFVWLWAKMFYAHRQRKWIRLLGGSE